MTVPHRVVVNNVESYLASCQAGMGLIQVPRFDVQQLLADGDLVEVLPDWPAPPMPVAALYLHRHQRSRRMAVFIDWFQGLLGRAVAGAHPPMPVAPWWRTAQIRGGPGLRRA